MFHASPTQPHLKFSARSRFQMKDHSRCRGRRRGGVVAEGLISLVLPGLPSCRRINQARETFLKIKQNKNRKRNARALGHRNLLNCLMPWLTDVVAVSW